MQAYVCRANVTSVNFEFSINSDEEVSDLYFVVENPPTWSEHRLVTVSATVQWQEKQTLGFALLGFFIGGILTLVGLATTLACGIYALATKGKKPPSKPEITRICPHCGRVLKQEAKFCPYCGKELEARSEG